MLNQFRKPWLLPIILIMILAAFFIVSPVYADEGQPVDPPPVPQEVQPAEGASTPASVDAPPEPVPPIAEESVTPLVEETVPLITEPGQDLPADVGDADPLVEELPVIPQEVPVGSAPTEAETPAMVDEPALLGEVVETLAENEVVLATSSGRSTALATVSASDGVIAGDPYYWIGATKYRFVKSGDSATCGTDIGITCFASNTPIQAAIDYMQTTGTPTDRKLFIEADDEVYTDYVSVNGTVPGVKGLLSIIGLGDLPEDVTITGGIYVQNMTSGFTIQNLKVNNTTLANSAGIWIKDTSGTIKLVDVETTTTHTDSSGIIIDVNGSVTLNRVQSSGNAYHGALLHATGGSVTVQNSVFDDNLNLINDGIPEYDLGSASMVGLQIEGNKPVLLNGVSAQRNNGDGVDISCPLSSITIKNSVFNENLGMGLWGDGLWIEGKTVSLEGIHADNNSRRGIVAYADASFTGSQIWADANSGTGLQIVSCFDLGDSDPNCDNTGAGTVSLTFGSSTSNLGDGVNVYAKGATSIKDFYTTGNLVDGYNVSNIDAVLPAPITITNSEAWSNGIPSGGYGFVMSTKGIVTLTDLIGNGNYWNGLNIDHPSQTPITVTNAPGMFNQMSENGVDGFYIHTLGPVVVNNMIANGNIAGYGGYIDNDEATIAAPVTIGIILQPGHSSYNSFDDDYASGLAILSKGLVTITNIYASNSENGYGLFIDNHNGIKGVTIKQISPYTGAFDLNLEDGVNISTTGPVLVNLSSISGNGGDGIDVTSKGAVTLTFSYANNNDGQGISIVANSGPGAVTVTGVPGEVFYNGDLVSENGIYILAKGNIKVDTVDVRWSPGYGGYLDNSFGSGTITIYRGRFNGNDNGLWVDTFGTITWNTGGAYNNDSQGAELHNEDALTPKSVTIIGLDTSENNNGTGLQIYSKGVVTVTNSRFYNNDLGYGLYIDNTYGTGSVNVTSTLADNSNGGNGNTNLYILSKGAVTVTKEDLAESDSGGGLYIDNSASLATPGVTVTFVNTNYNADDGVSITSNGIILIKNSGSSTNGLDGFLIDNTTGIAPVTMNDIFSSENGSMGIELDTKGIVVFTNVSSQYNTDTGIAIETLGAVTFKNVDAIGNDGYGASVTTSGAFITLLPVGTANSFNENALDGLKVNAGGLITLNRVEAEYNGTRDGFGDPVTFAYGVILNNSSNGTGLVPVVINDLTADGNTLDGSNILTTSAITLTNITANDNNQFGVHAQQLPAISSTLFPIVTLTNISVGNNVFDGLYVDARGSIVAGKLNAYSNLDSGIVLSNTGGKGSVTILNTLGANSALFNGADSGVGLFISSNGIVTVTGFDVSGNDSDGLVVNNSTAPIVSAVNLSNIVTRNNNGTGIAAISTGIVTINNSLSINNTEHGISVLSHSNTFINNTASINNDRAGIYVDLDDTDTLKLTNSTWFGNLQDPVLNDDNLMYDCNLTIV